MAQKLKLEYFMYKEQQNEKEEAIRNAKNFDELLDIQYGEIGNKIRDEFEEKAQYFVISEMLKSARHEAHLTQEQLANKVGTKRVISHVLKMVSVIFNYQLFTEYLKMV